MAIGLPGVPAFGHCSKYNNTPGINICSKCRIASLKAWRSGCYPRFATLFSTRGGTFRLLLPPPCPPALTAPREGLLGGLLDGSCGRRRHRVMRNRLNVGTYVPASEHERSSEDGVEKNFDCHDTLRRIASAIIIVHTIADKSRICDASIIH